MDEVSFTHSSFLTLVEIRGIYSAVILSRISPAVTKPQTSLGFQAEVKTLRVL